MSLPAEFEDLSWEEFPALREVVERWLARASKIMPIAEYRELLDTLKQTAFSAAKAWDEHDRQRLFDLVTKALTDGLTLKEFKENAMDVLKNQAYANVVFDTNMAAARAAGQYAVEFGEDLDIYPYWEFMAIEDSRNDTDKECPGRICRELNGKVFDKRDRASAELLPPLHFGCRCKSISVSADYAGRISGGSEEAGTHPRPKGWDYNRLEALVPDVFRRLFP